MAGIIAISNPKGGSGKTTLCQNLGYCLAKRGKRVLAVDLDSLGGLTTGFGVDKSSIGKSSYDVLLDGRAGEDDFMRIDDSLFLLPANLNLAGAEVELAAVKGRERLLKTAIDRMEGFDFILLDCPPSLSLVTVNALVAADGVIIPITSEFLSFEGAISIVKTARMVKATFNPALEILGAVINNYDGRSLISRQIAEKIRECFDEKTFSTVIPKCVRVTEAVSHGVAVGQHDQSGKGARAFDALADEFLARLG